MRGEMVIYDILGTCKQRIGSTSDGGYVLVEEGLNQIEEVFSFGVADDAMFEIDLKRRYPNIQKIHLFDPSITEYETPATRDMDLYLIGIGGKDEEKGQYGWKYYSL